MEYIPWIRSKVGNRKIFMVAGTVVVQDKNGRILLQRRADFDVWAMPGGALEREEDIETCARRELFEESGLQVGALRLIGIYSHPKYDVTYPNGDQIQQFNVCFAGQVNGGEMQVDGHETIEQRFFAVDEIPWDSMPIWYTDVLHDLLCDQPPQFSHPYSNGNTQDQIKMIRPFIGNDLYIGVSATVAATREDGRILMIRRRDTGTWFFPAGYADLGENVANTAVRETYEETGYHIQLDRLLGVYSSPQFHNTYANGDQVKNVGAMFRAHIIGGEARPQLSEVSEIGWLTPDEIIDHLCNSRFKPYAEKTAAYFAEGNFVM